MILYRPVGLTELILLYRSGLERFPPRLPEQPIFYPVIDRDYAKQIAKEWNTRSESLVGYLTEFEVDDAYTSSLPVQQAGARTHREFWIPAGLLDQFNKHIVGLVRIIDAFFGPLFTGIIPEEFSLRGKDARAQLQALCSIHAYNLMDFHGEITANHEAVFAHYPFWQQIVSVGEHDNFVKPDQTLQSIRKVCKEAFPGIPLGVDKTIAR